MANTRLAIGERNARLWEISWMARKQFWLAVAPITYAVRKNFQEKNEVSFNRYAQRTCNATTKRTTYFVSGSGPHSFVTLVQLLDCMIVGKNGDDYFWVRLDNSHSSRPMWLLRICPEEVLLFARHRYVLLLQRRLSLHPQRSCAILSTRSCSDRRSSSRHD